MPRRLVITAALVSAVATTTVVAIPSISTAATPAIRITKIYYDSPNADRGGNTSLNAEWVRITNTTSTNRSLTGWTLKDKTGYTYKFPTFTLKAKASVYVHTGKGAATSSHRYYNRTWYVWNNTGDTASLRDSKGVLKDSWAFKPTKSGYVVR
jgi:hypothetical protein